MISQVQDFRRNGKFKQANELCLQLLKEQPENALFHFHYAYGLDILAMETEAISHYKKSIQLGLAREELEGAFIALGTIYLKQGRYEDARKIFDSAMDTFANEPQIRLYYALSLYHVKEYEEGIHLMMEIATTKTWHEGILKNRRSLQFLSGRLEKPAEKVINLKLDDKYEPSATSIVEKVRKTLRYFEVSTFYAGKYAEYDDYYLYFDHPDKETRRCAIVQLTLLLGVWSTGSAHPFIPQHERKLDDYNPYHPFYELHHYITTFYRLHERIKSEFPIMHEYIINFFIQIEQKHGLTFEKMFPELDGMLVQRFREEVLIPNESKQHTPIQYFFKEAGVRADF